MQLQQFVTETVEQLGGVVIPVEYALCHVLIPESYTSYFQNRTEFELSFDFEVAQENPESEFVTFGSYVLEQLLAIVQQQSTSTLRFAEIDRLELSNPLKKLSEFLKDEPGKISLKSERPVLGLWVAFQYNVSYLSDEKTETSEQLWVNLLNNEISPAMKRDQNRIIYKQEPLYTYPIPATVDMSVAFERATDYVKELAEQEKQDQTKENMLAKDIDRIMNYYTELIAENNKKANRKGLTEEKVEEIGAKSETIELERDKQLQEIYNKYNGDVEVNVDNGALYFIPLLEFSVEIQFRANVRDEIFYYNPVTKQFFQAKTLVAMTSVSAK